MIEPLIDPKQLFQGTEFHAGSYIQKKNHLNLNQKILILKLLSLAPVVAIITLTALASSMRYKTLFSPKILAMTLIVLPLLHFPISVRLRMIKKESEWIMSLDVLFITSVLMAAVAILVDPNLIKGRIKDSLHFASAYLIGAIVIPFLPSCRKRRPNLM